MKYPKVIRAVYSNGKPHGRYLGVVCWGKANRKRRTVDELQRLRDQIDTLLNDLDPEKTICHIAEELRSVALILENERNCVGDRIRYAKNKADRLFRQLETIADSTKNQQIEIG